MNGRFAAAGIATLLGLGGIAAAIALPGKDVATLSSSTSSRTSSATNSPASSATARTVATASQPTVKTPRATRKVVCDDGQQTLWLVVSRGAPCATAMAIVASWGKLPADTTTNVVDGWTCETINGAGLAVSLRCSKAG